MSVSVLTYWGVPNYGAYAQAYALNAVLRQLGHKTEHITYLHPLHHQLYAPPSLFPCLRFWHPRSAWGRFRAYFAKRSYNQKFIADQHYIPHTPRMSRQGHAV